MVFINIADLHKAENNRNVLQTKIAVVFVFIQKFEKKKTRNSYL